MELCRLNGRWSVPLLTATWLSSHAPASPFFTGSGTRAIFSSFLQSGHASKAVHATHRTDTEILKYNDLRRVVEKTRNDLIRTVSLAIRSTSGFPGIIAPDRSLRKLRTDTVVENDLLRLSTFLPEFPIHNS